MTQEMIAIKLRAMADHPDFDRPSTPSNQARTDAFNRARTIMHGEIARKRAFFMLLKDGPTFVIPFEPRVPLAELRT